MNSKLVYLNSNDATGLLGFGEGKSIVLDSGAGLDQIDDFIKNNTGTYIFMALSYDLKNEIENLDSQNSDIIEFPSAILWCPDFVIEIDHDELSFLKGEPGEDAYKIIEKFLNSEQDDKRHKIELSPVTSKEDYLANVISLKNEIQNGNIYEVNYCQNFVAQNVDLDNPYAFYFNLNRVTNTPFSTFFKFNQHEVFSGSPERFIRKVDRTLISQPIKGTIGRGKDVIDDQKLIKQLANDPKERAENVMIVDLVRNDLSKIAQTNSVKVDELCGIYSFDTVHQMISTVSCDLKNGTSFTDILKALFPMGSMTGAPKISAMQLIEKHEDFKRGLYSGSIGYIDPKGDFDFNVIIRSILYNRDKKTMSCGVGGAITIQSSPEAEYAECFTKVSSILNSLHEKD